MCLNLLDFSPHLVRYKSYRLPARTAARCTRSLRPQRGLSSRAAAGRSWPHRPHLGAWQLPLWCTGCGVSVRACLAVRPPPVQLSLSLSVVRLLIYECKRFTTCMFLCDTSHWKRIPSPRNHSMLHRNAPASNLCESEAQAADALKPLQGVVRRNGSGCSMCARPWITRIFSDSRGCIEWHGRCPSRHTCQNEAVETLLWHVRQEDSNKYIRSVSGRISKPSGLSWVAKTVVE